MNFLQRVAAALALVTLGVCGSGCTTTLVLVHLHEKLTEGDPIPCMRLNGVERALQTRCGPFQPGSLVAADVVAPAQADCPLMLAARDPRLWPVLPELLARGALPERCRQSPLVALAAAHPCPPFEAAPAAQIDAMRWLARADARALNHDVMRALSCPSAQAAGLTDVLDGWLADGLLQVGQVSFSPLGALHPRQIDSPLSRKLEAQGHTAAAAFGAHDGRSPSGFDAALRDADGVALSWWLAREPRLVNRVPSAFAGQTAWLPLARVLSPAYLVDPTRQRWVVEFLLAHGADPWRRLPHEPQRTVVSLAQELKSPLVGLLDPPVLPARSVAQAMAHAKVNVSH